MGFKSDIRVIKFSFTSQCSFRALCVLSRGARSVFSLRYFRLSTKLLFN